MLFAFSDFALNLNLCITLALLFFPGCTAKPYLADSHDAFRRFIGHRGLSRSKAAPPICQGKTFEKSIVEVSTKVSKTMQKLVSDVASPMSSVGIYYGFSPRSMGKHAGSNRPKTPKPKGLRDTMSDALEELRFMRMELEALRKELHEMQQLKPSFAERGLASGEDDKHHDDVTAPLVNRRDRQRDFEKLALEIEKWAEELLFEQKGDAFGWTEVRCNKMFQGMNRDERTTTFLKWMKDSRGNLATPSDEREYPCIKMYATIDAPLEEVCLYLSQAQYKDDYNDLIERHMDLEEITPHSKVCWGQTPQILFLKPRDFVTYCSHRWLRDGTQVMVNQACKDQTGTVQEDRPMAYALRGANYISRHPDDPEKTRICMVSHGNPGSDVPKWAMKTAVNSLVPIEPFKLFHKINQGIQNCREELEQKSRQLDDMELVSSGGVSRRPAGLAQLGYACFWPEGGGIQEGGADTAASTTTPPVPGNQRRSEYPSAPIDSLTLGSKADDDCNISDVLPSLVSASADRAADEALTTPSK